MYTQKTVTSYIIPHLRKDTTRPSNWKSHFQLESLSQKLEFPFVSDGKSLLEENSKYHGIFSTNQNFIRIKERSPVR